MTLAAVLASSSDIKTVYAVEITALKTIKYWTPSVSSGSPGFDTPFPFDGDAIVSNVNYNGVPLVLVVDEATVNATPGTWFWDQTNIYIRLLLDQDPRIDQQTVTIELTYHFATHAKVFNNIFYQPLLLSTPILSLRVEQDFSGIGQISTGTTILDNSGKFFDQLSDLDWDGGKTTVYFGADQPKVGPPPGIEMIFSDYVKIGTWLNDSWEKNNNQFILQNVEYKQRLTLNIPQRLYSLALYPNMMTNDIGRPIPLAYGQILGAAPVCIDVNNKIFKLADHPISGIQEVRVASNSNWVLAPYTSDLLNGQLTIASWDGQSNVSVDFRGKKNPNGSWMDNASDIVADILSFIGENKLDQTSFNTSHKNLILGLGPDSSGNISQAVSSLSLPSIGSYVDAPYNAALDAVTGDFTIEGWIYQTSANTNNGIFNRGNAGGTQGPFAFGFFTGGNTQIGVRMNGSTVLGDSVPVGQWCHVAAVRQGSTVTLFVNGNHSAGAVGTYGTALSYSGEKVFAGLYYSTNNSFLGNISELRFSSVARYTAPFTPPSFLGSDSNTVLYFKFNEGTGTSAVDSSPSGITGTLRGAATWADRVQAAGIEIAQLVPSIFLDSNITAQDVFQKINQLVGSYLFVDANGFYRYVVFVPQQGEALQFYDDTSILNFKKTKPSLSVQSLVSVIFANRLQDGWGQFLTEERKSNQYSKGQPAQVYAGSQQIDLTTFNDAEYFALRQLIFLGDKPKIFEFGLPWPALLFLPTNQFHISYSRYNLDIILEIVEINKNDDMIQLVVSNLHNFDSSTGFWLEDSDVLPTRFANLVGYGAGSLTWNDNWDQIIKTWWEQNCGGWTDDNGFMSSTDKTSFLKSAWF